MQHRKCIVLAAGGLTAVMVTAACSSGGSASTAAAPSSPSSAASSPAAALTCSDINSVMTPVVADQKSQDASETQNWVNLVPSNSGGSDLTSQGQDLQNALSSIGNITGTNTLTGDLQAFVTDGNNFLTDEGNGLMPGWTSGYNQLKGVIYSIASLCGIS